MECLNIELSEHHILAQNRTSDMSNITKNRTVREHRTVRSKTNIYLSFIIPVKYFTDGIDVGLALKINEDKSLRLGFPGP